MKARPRRVEREVAAHLRQMFLQLGCSPVERIPVLGRSGPDISTNEIGLVIDVKSRLCIPTSYFIREPTRFRSGEGEELVGFPLDRLLDLPTFDVFDLSLKSSVTVIRWFAHMDDWTRAHLPQGISALVLHQPKMPVGKATFLFHFSQLEVLKCRILQQSPSIPLPTTRSSPPRC